MGLSKSPVPVLALHGLVHSACLLRLGWGRLPTEVERTQGQSFGHGVRAVPSSGCALPHRFGRVSPRVGDRFGVESGEGLAMKRLILASLAGIIGACGGTAPQSLKVPADASTVGQGDLGTGNAAETVEASRDWFDVPADAVAGAAEVGYIEVRPVDGIPAIWDLAPAEVAWPVDSPLISEAGGFDAGVVGERPRPIDGSNATCEDQVLSYDDKVPGAYMSGVNSLAFSPDGQTLAAGIEHSIVWWQVGGGADGGGADGGGSGIDGGGGGVDGGGWSGPWKTCPAGIDA